MKVCSKEIKLTDHRSLEFYLNITFQLENYYLTHSSQWHIHLGNRRPSMSC